MGTAKHARAPFFRRHLAADLGDGQSNREAVTTTAADQVIDHLVNHDGLHPDRDAVPEPGKIVFVYRPTTVDQSLAGRGAAVQPAPPSDHAAFPRRTA